MKSLMVVSALIFFTAQCGLSPGQSNTNGNPSNSQSVSADKNRDGWQTVRWERQGFTFTLPPDWRKDDLSSGDKEEKSGAFRTSSSVTWEDPVGQSLDVSVETGKEDFPYPAEKMLEIDYEIDRDRKAAGKIPIDDLHYLELDGVKGEYFRRSFDYKQEVLITWMTYRHYKGKAQHIFIMAHGPKKELETMMKILNSAKVARD